MVAPMRLALIRLAARVFETRMSADSIKVPLDLKMVVGGGVAPPESFRTNDLQSSSTLY